MKNVITTCGNIPAQPDILDEMLPCEGVHVHFSHFHIDSLPMGWKLKLSITVNGFSEQWHRCISANEMESHPGNYWGTDPREKAEAVLYGIGEVLDRHYDQLMKYEG